jgi:HEAT repeat protein
MLSTGGWSTLESIFQVLGSIGDPRSLEPIAAKLEDENWHVRESAVAALGMLKDPLSLEPLVKRLKDENPGVRQNACKALGRMGDARGLEPLMERLKDENWQVRVAACSALGAFREPGVAESLLLQLGDDNPDIRQAACLALGEVGAPQGVIPLIDRLGDESPGVREGARSSLEKLGEGKLAGAVAGALSGSRDALSRLGEMGEREDMRALNPLLFRLGDRNGAMRDAARDALVSMGKGAVDALIARLGGDDPMVRQAACQALEKLGEGRLAQAVAGALSGRAGAGQELERLSAGGDLRPLQPLLERLADLDPDVRRFAREAMRHMGTAPVIPLVSRLADSRLNVRQSARDALEAIGPAGVEILAGELSRDSFQVRQAVCDVLASIGVASVDPLAGRLLDGSLPVRRAACKSLNVIYRKVKPRINGMLCREHLARFELRTTRSPEAGTAFYAVCRKCGMSGRALFDVKEVVAVIDDRMEGEYAGTEGSYFANFLKRNEFFDFDRVEIARTNDYNVYQFCGRLKDDKDLYRREYYSRIECRVRRDCNLSENTLRVLRGIFGRVVLWE